MTMLQPLAIVMFVVRTAGAILFILFMTTIFFSSRVQVHEDGMKRFVFELSDSLVSSELTDYKSVFSAQKLTAAEQNKNIELYSSMCDFGYYASVTSLTQQECSRGSDCADFCKSTCGLDDSTIDMAAVGTLSGNCGCSLREDLCQCKKNDEWLDSYKWNLGSAPGKKIVDVSSEFPVGVNTGDSVVPAKLIITAYDSFLTRLSCLVVKATELKEPAEIKFNRADAQFASNNPVFRRSGTDGTHVCVYNSQSGIETPVDCRYLPDVHFESFSILQGFDAKTGTITAYPVKRAATCAEIKANPSLISGKNDAAATVVLCTKGDK